jgi:caffeoyl-CoA O-methyltransferase
MTDGLEKYRRDLFAREDEVLRSVMPAAVAQGLPDISVDPDAGKTLHLLARMVNAKKILEFGSLAGYSGIWLARALGAGGKLISLEIDPKHAEIARANYKKAGVADRAEVHVGPASQTMKSVAAEGPFDLVFIDADKEGYPEYLEFALANTRPGSLIVADNARPRSLPATSARDKAITAYNERVTSHPKLVSNILPTGGWLAVSLVVG